MLHYFQMKQEIWQCNKIKREKKKNEQSLPIVPLSVTKLNTIIDDETTKSLIIFAFLYEKVKKY